MSAPLFNAGAQPQDPPDRTIYAPPAGPPPPGMPSAPYNPYGPPPPGQPSYPYGSYPPPPSMPGYNAPPGQYPAGQYQPSYLGYPPPAGAPGQYVPPSGQPQYAPPPGPSPGAQYPPSGAPYGAPTSGYPPPPGAPMSPFGAAPVQEPLVFLGTAIPDPNAPPAPLGAQKVPGYDPSHDYNELMRSTAVNLGNDSKRQSLSPLSLSNGAPAKRSLSISSRFSMASSKSKSANTYNGLPNASSPTVMPVPQFVPHMDSVPGSRTSIMGSAVHSFMLGTANLLMLDTQCGVLVMKVLLNLNVFQMDALNDHFTAKQGITLYERVEKTTSGNFGLAAGALALGPLKYDVELARKALVGMGANEMLLTELILGRPSHEIRLLKAAYTQRFNKDLIEAVKSDLSGPAERMFVMALNAQKPASNAYDVIDQARVAEDVEALHQASKKKNEIIFFEIMINRSDRHLTDVIAMFALRYKSLGKVIKRTFSGVVEQGLLYIFNGVKPKRDQHGYWRDAKLLEKSMAGLGTKDQQLIYRLVRAHWNPYRMEAIKDAYKKRYGKTLEHRVKGETSGTYRDLLLALVKGPGQQ